ncbi:MAG: TIGR02757 family protein [Candidatus Sumerlaeia bacterium]|nr:TIGR02757 family protein [Candidatus Sumerlaeia bacterium]
MTRPALSAATLSAARLRVLLEGLHAEFHRPEWLGSDPLGIVRTYDDPADREVVALIAASFAFGNVKAIRSSLNAILEPLGPHPAAMLAERAPADWGRHYRGFLYRWVRAQDLRLYLSWLGEALRRHQSLGNLWAALDQPGEATTVPTLARWIEALTALPTSGLRPRRRQLRRATGECSILPSGAHLLLTSPAGRSGCKRMNLFLRWVCRPDDGIDLGLWPVSPARLVMPVDTHVLQAARLLGLTRRTTADLRTALKITDALRAVAPEDPTRYDFALVRPGILGLKQLIDGA